MSYENSGKLEGLVDLLIECDIIETRKLDTKEEVKANIESTGET